MSPLHTIFFTILRTHMRYPHRHTTGSPASDKCSWLWRGFPKTLRIYNDIHTYIYIYICNILLSRERRVGHGAQIPYCLFRANPCGKEVRQPTSRTPGLPHLEMHRRRYFKTNGGAWKLPRLQTAMWTRLWARHASRTTQHAFP